LLGECVSLKREGGEDCRVGKGVIKDEKWKQSVVKGVE
jgi:hypothetical protein